MESNVVMSVRRNMILTFIIVMASTLSFNNAMRRLEDDSMYSTTEPVSLTDETPVQAMGSSFIQTQGQQFFLDGKPLFVNGVNLYYLMTKAAIPELRPLIAEILQESASVGTTVVRAWAFADGYGAGYLQKQPGVYSEEVFQVCCHIRVQFMALMLSL